MATSSYTYINDSPGIFHAYPYIASEALAKYKDNILKSEIANTYEWYTSCYGYGIPKTLEEKYHNVKTE